MTSARRSTVPAAPGQPRRPAELADRLGRSGPARAGPALGVPRHGQRPRVRGRRQEVVGPTLGPGVARRWPAAAARPGRRRRLVRHAPPSHLNRCLTTVGDACAILASPRARRDSHARRRPGRACRQRTRDQLELLRADDHGLLIVSETDDPADFNFICDRTHVLLPPEDGRDPEHRRGELDARGLLRRAAGPTSTTWADSDDGQPDALACPGATALPSRRGLRRPGPARTLAELDGDPAFGPGSPRPTTSSTSLARARCCPATEPAETGLTDRGRRVNPNANAGAGVSVVVIDTGWYPARADPGVVAERCHWRA